MVGPSTYLQCRRPPVEREALERRVQSMTGETTTAAPRWHDALARLRRRLNGAIRQGAGLTKDPPPRCNDPALAYIDVNGVARVVHGDLPPMLIGGLGSLFLQMLHPYAMAGVAQHSRYQDDPLGRLLQTANFIGATTYGSKESAKVAIDRVRHVHDFVHGVADDGASYDANDPHLLLWVHCAEITMFLRGYQRFGARHLSRHDADAYVKEMVPLGVDLGVLAPPQNVAELDALLASFRSELRLTPHAREARDFIAFGVPTRRLQRLVHRLFVRNAQNLLPTWAADLLDVRRPSSLDRLVIRPVTSTLCSLIRLAVPPATAQLTIESPPSTTTT